MLKVHDPRVVGENDNMTNKRALWRSVADGSTGKVVKAIFDVLKESHDLMKRLSVFPQYTASVVTNKQHIVNSRDKVIPASPRLD